MKWAALGTGPKVEGLLENEEHDTRFLLLIYTWGNDVWRVQQADLFFYFNLYVCFASCSPERNYAMPPFAKAFAAQRRIGAVFFSRASRALLVPFWQDLECHSLYFVQRSNVGGLSACLTRSAAPGGTYIPFQPSCLLNASIRLVCLPFRKPLWRPLDPLISFLCLKLLHLPPAWLL